MKITKKDLIRLAGEIDYKNRWNRFGATDGKYLIFMQLTNISKRYRDNGANSDKIDFVQKLQDNKEFISDLISADIRCLEAASDRLKQDREFIVDLLKKDGLALKYASDDLKSDKEVVLVAVKQYNNAINFASNDLQQFCKDKDPVKALESLILAESLQSSLVSKPERRRGTKIKI